MLQADTIANAAERAGKKVAQIDWVGGAAAGIDGPTVDFTNFFSTRGVLVGAANAIEQARLGVLRRHLPGGDRSLRPRGWTNVPAGDPAAPPKQTTLTIDSTFAAQNPNRIYDVYFYDSVTDGGATYDHAIVEPGRQDGRGAVDRPEVGDFQPIKLTGADGLIGARAGQTAGHYVKLISLAPDAEPVQALLHLGRPRDRDVRHARATRLPAGGAGEDRLEKYIADNLLPWAAADFAPEEARRHRRGHLRPAGPRPRAGLQPAGDRLHPGHAAAGHRPRDGRLPVHRRGLAPVHGPRHADRHRTAARTRTTTYPEVDDGSAPAADGRPSPPARATSAAPTTRPTRSSASRAS